MKPSDDREYATQKEIERASELYCAPSGGTIDMDDRPKVSVADDGVWVQAWLWLPNEKE